MNDNEEKLQSINTIVNSTLTIAYGISLLTNSLLDGVISNTVGNWYELLALFLMLICVSNAIFRKAPQYTILIFSLIGIYIYLRFSRASFGNLGYIKNVPILLLFIGLGLFISFFITKGSSGFLKLSIMLVCTAIIFIIASFMDIYNLIVPALIVGISLIFLTYAIIRHCYNFSGEKKQIIDDKLEKRDTMPDNAQRTDDAKPAKGNDGVDAVAQSVAVDNKVLSKIEQHEQTTVDDNKSGEELAKVSNDKKLGSDKTTDIIN